MDERSARTNEPITYKAAGVDIEACYDAVRRIRRLAQTTFRPEVLGDIGSFGGFFAIEPGKWKQPVLVAGTDGVGTKLKIAFLLDKHDTIGIDAVAYCVNDILCQGAEPLFFLDYLAVGKLVPDQAEAIVAGVAKGCRQANCALIGGETAEMPGFYAPGEYDLAGFTVGVVERERSIDGRRVQVGDAIVGIRSTGLQSSGFSLVRRLVLDHAKMQPDQYVAELGRTIGEELLEPTGIYVKPILDLCRRFDIRGIANISGGGLPENLPRAMAPGTKAQIQLGSWEMPPIFPFLQRLGDVPTAEMFKTFNMGIAMTLIVPSDQVKSVLDALAEHGETGYLIGRVVAGDPGVDLI